VEIKETQGGYEWKRSNERKTVEAARFERERLGNVELGERYVDDPTWKKATGEKRTWG